MRDLIHSGPTTATQALRALRRYPDRVAFVSETAACPTAAGRSNRTYAGGSDRKRLQAWAAAGGPYCNRAEAWCAGIAASAAALSTTWLHPLGSVADQIDQIEDGECAALVVDAANFLQRGGELAAQAKGLSAVYTAWPCRIRHGSGGRRRRRWQRDRSRSGIELRYRRAQLHRRHNRKIEGRLAYARAGGRIRGLDRPDFEIPIAPRYLLIAPMSYVAGATIRSELDAWRNCAPAQGLRSRGCADDGSRASTSM